MAQVSMMWFSMYDWKVTYESLAWRGLLYGPLWRGGGTSRTEWSRTRKLERSSARSFGCPIPAVTRERGGRQRKAIPFTQNIWDCKRGAKLAGKYKKHNSSEKLPQRDAALTQMTHIHARLWRGEKHWLPWTWSQLQRALQSWTWRSRWGTPPLCWMCPEPVEGHAIWRETAQPITRMHGKSAHWGRREKKQKEIHQVFENYKRVQSPVHQTSHF